MKSQGFGKKSPRLVLHGGYAAGWRVRADAAEIARREAMQTLILHGWGQNNPAFRQVFTSAFIPEGTPEQFRWMNELMRVSTSPQNAVRILEALSRVDVRDRLLMVQVPTLVLHSRNDGRIPYQLGLELAQIVQGGGCGHFHLALCDPRPLVWFCESQRPLRTAAGKNRAHDRRVRLPASSRWRPFSVFCSSK